MDREFLLTTLDYRELNGRDRNFWIQELRGALLRVVKLLGQGSYNFFSEPVDLLTLSNQEDPMHAELRSEEPAVVLTNVSGVAVRATSDPDGGEVYIGRLKSVVVAALKSLRSLHKDKCVIQQFKMGSVRFNRVTHQVTFTGVYTVMRMDEFIGFNERRATLAPDPRFAAPEVLDPKGSLTPATDIYAVGKLALQLLLGHRYLRQFTREQPFPAEAQNLINSLDLPEPWPRFLSTCLQLDPARRFQTASEAEIFLLPKAKRVQSQSGRYGAGAAPFSEMQRPRPESVAVEGMPGSASATKRSRGAWYYRENPGLPDGMLLIWGDRLCARGEMLDYVRLYQDFMYKLNLNPRMFFQTQHAGNAGDNPFFKMLRERLGLEVVVLDGKDDPAVVLQQAVGADMKEVRDLVLVGGADEAGVQFVLQRPEARHWRIHWVRAAGQWTPDVPLYAEIGVGKYIRAKRK